MGAFSQKQRFGHSAPDGNACSGKIAGGTQKWPREAPWQSVAVLALSPHVSHTAGDGAQPQRATWGLAPFSEDRHRYEAVFN